MEEQKNPNLHTITFDEVSNFKIDNKTNELYWCEKKIVTTQIINLRIYELVIAIVATLATIASSVFAGLDFFLNTCH